MPTPPNAPSSSASGIPEGLEQLAPQRPTPEPTNTTTDTIAQGVYLLDAFDSLSDIAGDVGAAILSTAGDVLAGIGNVLEGLGDL